MGKKSCRANWIFPADTAIYTRRKATLVPLIKQLPSGE